MLSREAIEALVPHAGAMCLWDEVLDWNGDTIRLRARNHRDTAHPLRSEGRLRAIHLCEYGAQAMAVHGGLIAQRDGRIAALIPHQGGMCLWDEVVDWDAGTIRLRSRGHRDPAHPLRSHGRLRAVHLCEYGAQAMAVHGGLRASVGGTAAQPGLLVARHPESARREAADAVA